MVKPLPLWECRRTGLDPWVGKISCRRKRQPTPVLLPGESHRQRSLVGYSPWSCKESDTTKQLHFTSHIQVSCVQCSVGHAMHGWARTSPPQSLLFLPQALEVHRSTLIEKQNKTKQSHHHTWTQRPHPFFHSSILSLTQTLALVCEAGLYSTQVSGSRPPGSWQEDVQDGQQHTSHPHNFTSPSPTACLSPLLSRHCWLYDNRKAIKTLMKDPRKSSNLGQRKLRVVISSYPCAGIQPGRVVLLGGRLKQLRVGQPHPGLLLSP